MNADKKIGVQTASSLRLGLLAPASSYGGVGSRLTGLVLEHLVEFDPSRYVHARRAMFDVLAFVGPKMPMLSFVLHIEDARLHWLADPTEPAVWQAIDTWDRHGTVSVALSREETHTFVIPLPGKLGERIGHLRKLCNQKPSDTFVLQAIEMFELGVLYSCAPPNTPTVAHSSACVLNTRRVEQSFKRLGYEISRAANGSKGFIFCARKEVQVDASRDARTLH